MRDNEPFLKLVTVFWVKVSFYSQSRPSPIFRYPKRNAETFFRDKVIFLFLEVSVKKFYQSEQNCFVQNIYTAEINTCNVEKCPCEPTRRREAVSPCCVCAGRQGFSRSDLTVQLVSQAEQVNVQSKQT